MLMEKYNMKFYCQHGKFALQECTRLPTKESLEENFKVLEELGLGKVKKIVIDKIV